MTSTNEAIELKSETVALLVEKIKGATTVEQVQEIAGTDDRKGVVNAAAKRISEIQGQPAQPIEGIGSAGEGARGRNAKRETINKIYEEFPVKPEYEIVTDQLGKVIGKKLTGYKKDALEPLRTVSIDPAKAEILNSQSENTLVHLFEKK